MQNILHFDKRSGGIFDPRCLFVETMPIYKAVATGTEIMSFTEKRQVQIANNPRLPQCQAEPELLSSPPPNFSLQSTFK